MSRTLRLVLVLLAVSLFALAVTGQVVYARLSYLWILLVSVNFIIVRFSLSGIELTRRVRSHRAQVGDVFKENFDVTNQSRLPLLFWLEIQDKSELPGGHGSRVLVTIGARRTRSYISRTKLISRGVYPLGPTRLASGDLFGLFSVHREVPARGVLTVYPRLVYLHSLPVPRGLLPGGEALHRRTHQITPNAATVREYASGDPISRIHWPSTARRNRLIVKEFELDPLAEVWIFVDGEKSVQSRLDFELDADAASVFFKNTQQPVIFPSTEEYATSIAASIAQYYLLVGRAVGLVSTGKTPDLLSAERGPRQLNKIMETLGLLRADGELGIEKLAVNYARHLPRGSTVYIVTPSARPELIAAASQLRRLGLRPLVALLDAKSFAGEEGSAKLSIRLIASGIPTILVAEGEDLAGAIQRFDVAAHKVTLMPN